MEKFQPCKQSARNSFGSLSHCPKSTVCSCPSGAKQLLAMWLSAGVSRARRWLKLPYWSLSAYLKFKVKMAVEFLARYEEIVVREAQLRGCQGVICGHVHTPSDRMIGDIHYLNDGDWVESCSALVEHMDGRFEIIYWHKLTEVQADLSVNISEAIPGLMALA